VPVIGFDLDMTLVDSADAIVECLRYACEQHGVEMDDTWVRSTIGLPLDEVFAVLLPGVPYDEPLAHYRARYLTRGLDMQELLPAAREVLETVTADGWRVMVVSAKKDTHVEKVLEVVGLDGFVDLVVGERFGDQKGESLREEGAEVYVGDHPGDVVGARVAGAVAVAVSTGPTPADALRHAGADVVLDDLTQFVPWWHAYLATRGSAVR
jgi:phosphoglycolate phosphatase